ncbi:CRISPR-associated endoribonuclease Cas6 [Fervidobacterium sp. 2310opik-2]|uniref:CRISPR-associated endoribonuclease Cas6 n=1 Tax=Fervidobacterium sp. 2310opik-2 TaxID=1755815 RepID=UPI0013DF4B12|nr:CRISPR-associated endoribonuclease Cas6 [Fervidobacterium sp. 2310opik-2]KAF2961051.1 hypothetical protein AS161_03490 [Fervidobacterium sp. 2310opik-2]
MFYSSTITLIAQNDTVISNFIGKKIHGWFFKLLKEADEQLSTVLHSNISNKSFTVSSFIGQNVSKPLTVEKGKPYHIRVTFLEDRLFEIFSSRFFETKLLNEGVSIEQAEFVVDSFSIGNLNRWSGYISEEELFEYDNTDKQVTMKFYTPTLFKIGDIHLREPDPSKVFTSLLLKFNTYSKIKLDDGLKDRFDQIKVVYNDTVQKRVYLPGYYMQGFVGTVTFEAPEDEKITEAMNILSRFAFYSGVGYKTTMGLGQASRIEEKE